MKSFSTTRSRLALILGLSVLLPLASNLSSAHAQPPRFAPAYGHRTTRTIITRRPYHRAPIVTRIYRVPTPRRYNSTRTITRTTTRGAFGRPTATTIIRRSHR